MRWAYAYEHSTAALVLGATLAGAVLFACTPLIAGYSHAQPTPASLRGRVDKSRAVVPGAIVNVTKEPINVTVSSSRAADTGPLIGAETSTLFVNSQGAKMVRIGPGSFMMGSVDPTPPDAFPWAPPASNKHLKSPCHLTNGDFDERPIHKVTITKPFYMSETEVTEEQYRQFDPKYKGDGKSSPYVSGVSWEDARAFSEWLSKKEGKTYRLPTEAEWEYASRAGTQGFFSSGDKPPQPGQPNPWGLKNMHDKVLEWVFDWYGKYPDSDQTDPVGPAQGIARVIRGGGIQQAGAVYPDYYLGLSTYYVRSPNRGGLLPSFRPQEPVGFRIVEASLPRTPLQPPEAPPFVRQCIKQVAKYVTVGPDPNKPYFKRRFILPIPPENVPPADISAAGLPDGVLRHNHSPGMEVMPNGDVLAVYFTSGGYQDRDKDPMCASGEATPDIALLAVRLRYGSEQWDMPELLIDYPDINDVAPLLWNDKGVLRLFWGGYLEGVPFRTAISKDSGATWEDIRFVRPTGQVGPFGVGQPITSAFRKDDEAMYVACDASKSDSLLWVSRDGGETWADTGGRTGGRHSACVPLRDASILCLGGKSADIDGFMPQSISRDEGKTWQVSKTGFPALGGNQRPTLIRLASGRLFFASDYQTIAVKKPAAITEQGSFVALSEDEGKTWHWRTLPGSLPHEEMRQGPNTPPTIGYAVARQAPNSVIHLITSMNDPSQHFEMNENWILESGQPPPPTNTPQKSKIFKEQERYPDSKFKATWSARSTPGGGYVLHGTQLWLYQKGRKQWEVTYRDGFKTGAETYWSSDGHKQWAWEHRKDGTGVWTQWWPNGQKKSESSWRDNKAVGLATRWDPTGKMLGQRRFNEGRLVD